MEENHDENGIIWPINVAPYKVAIIIANMNHEKMTEEAEKLYKKLEQLGIDTLLDDRKDSIGVKYNDMDLIGIPIRITVGNDIDNDIVEVKLRNKNDRELVKLTKIYEYIQNMMIEYNKK